MTLAICLLLSSVCAAQQERDSGIARIQRGGDITSGVLRYREEARLLFHCHPLRGRGLRVAWVDRGSPTRRLKNVNDPTILATLIPRDVITHVDGQAITSLAGYYQIMRTVGDEVRLTIADANTRVVEDWDCKTVKVRVAVSPNVPNQITGSRVHIVYAALSDDVRLKHHIRVNVPQMQALFESQISSDRLGSLALLQGQDCNAKKIIEAINALQCEPQDSIFFYYEGHGAYDNRFAAGDPAEGHFFAMGPGGDLLRSRVLSAILAKKPRFTLLMSDCCNAEGFLSVEARQVATQQVVIIRGWTGLEELLFCYTGVLDLTASSRDEYSWFSTDIGGWFTSSFMKRMYDLTGEPRRDWKAEWDLLVNATEDLFQDRKRQDGGATADLGAQLHMYPMAFQFSVNRQDPADAPRGERQIIQTTFVSVQ